MRALMGLIAAAVRIFVGFVLVVVAITFAVVPLLNVKSDSPAYMAGQLTFAIVMSLIFGFVGVRMMLRRRMPRQSS